MDDAREMTREEAKRVLEFDLDHTYNDESKEALRMAIKALEQEPYDFVKWVATEIFDDMWEYNKDAFAEIACRKLAKLGIVRAKDNEWELIEPQESEDRG